MNSRWHGTIGFVITDEIRPGVFKSTTVEKTFYGEVLRNYNKIQNSDKTINDLVIDKQLSVIAKKFLKDNFEYMRYVIIEGVKWSITNAEPKYPRVVLSLGGVYHG